MSKRHKVLVTGSSGMLGTALCRELNKRYEVHGTDIVPRLSSLVPRFHTGDVTDRKEIAAIVKSVGPDFVIHAAAWTDVDGCELDAERARLVNSEGTENITSACKDSGAVLIYISTDFVFDGRKKRPYRESDRPRPLSVYADSKYRGEAAVVKASKRHFIIRTSWLFGPHGTNFVDTILNKAKQETALRVVDDQVGSPTYSIDLAKAIRVLLDKVFTQGAGRSMQYGIYHATNSGSVSWYEYAKEILKLVKSETAVIPISSEELNRPARRPAMSILDNARFARFTGFRMRDWRSALKEYLSKGA